MATEMLLQALPAICVIAGLVVGSLIAEWRMRR
jgi:hypothetical protein